MKRIIILGAAALMAAAAAEAKPITPQQALSRLGSSQHKMPGKDVAEIKLAHTATTESGSPAVYVFNRPEKCGYMLLSADDCALPLLGYADEGEFAPERMPEAMKWWLSEYARQIEYANENGLGGESVMQSPSRGLREPIEPMVTAKWDQIEPYNSQAPKYGAQQTYTGCVATTMAMVMHYWKYPECGRGSINYNASTIGKRLSLDFSKKKFDWDNMLETYDTEGDYTAEQIDAVAYLMKACGYSVKMNYSTSASGALAMNIGNAMVKYFNYDPNYRYALRLSHSATEWEDMIYDNLKNVGPVLYGGSSMIGGGHSFVCDGYDGDGYFHFNWGWSGISNGYFSLDALSPSALGSGGGLGGGYNFTQDAVLGIQPPTGKPAEEKVLKLIQMGSLNAEIVGGGTESTDSIKFTLVDQAEGMWVNYNPQTMKVRFGAIFEPQGDTPGGTKSYVTADHVFPIQAGYGAGTSVIGHALALTDTDLSDGTYKVTYATLADEAGAEWNPVEAAYGYYNYVVLHKQGEVYTVENEPVGNLKILDGGLSDRTLYFACMVRPTITVENPTDIEITRGFAPILLLEQDGVDYPFFLGESVLITVPPHSQVSREWVTDMHLMQNISGISTATNFKFTYFDETTYRYYTEEYVKEMTMMPNPGLPNVAFGKNPVIPGAEVVQESVIPGTIANVYVVKDKLSIPVEAGFKLANRGVFAYNMFACAMAPDWTDEGGELEILSQAGMPMFLSTSNTDFGVELSMPYAKKGVYYLIAMAYLYGSNYIPVDSSKGIIFRLDEPSAVENVTLEEIEASTAPIYNLQGVYVGTDWESLPSGLYIRSGKKIIKR